VHVHALPTHHVIRSCVRHPQTRATRATRDCCSIMALRSSAWTCMRGSTSLTLS
jgi:hypothetical protein